MAEEIERENLLFAASPNAASDKIVGREDKAR
jgi:hypothetical protein